jgi:Uma2 family endonuclease
MSIATNSATERLIAELYLVKGKAEVVNGGIVEMSPTGAQPSRAGGAIYASLRQYEKRIGGWAYPDNVAYVVDLPNRKSFSPDASFVIGRTPDMKFVQGAPDFAAEVRSEGDYGAAAEQDMAAKRSDYFAAGTKVVWDVDLLDDDIVRKYHAESPDTPTVFRRGTIADAEPAVSGWRFPVDELFD